MSDINPYQALAAGIIKQAVDDWAELPAQIQECKVIIATETDLKKVMKAQTDMARCRGEIAKLIRFFNLKWYKDLCDLMGLSHEYILKKAGVNDDSIREVKAL